MNSLRREHGRPRDEAVLEGNQDRLRRATPLFYTLFEDLAAAPRWRALRARVLGAFAGIRVSAGRVR
jgi:hypothetical protein